ncbi:MAG: hypothetical protein SOZ02_02580 [Hallerella porci]|uniref:Uncharacterized protein n=1 Tax=Hallerella porci TaxID=1945871 RepID=A0ABX5LR77_9BACT|nr:MULTISPECIES: hypothetical protein [Hallerella]MCI5601645.1 hypothetical protein [Hallerella sp.]MDY3921032.1 hypothetical protein [Hallerella porci]PWL03783.1 hypothetical protein B0H50_10377 [Hallerella porci]
MQKKLARFEVCVGGIAMILGAFISILVWNDGYFPGALMLVITGFLSVLLGIKEIKEVKDPAWQESFTKILRRTMLFLNLMLSLVVVGTLISMT